jgi:hypothetical protein
MSSKAVFLYHSESDSYFVMTRDQYDKWTQENDPERDFCCVISQEVYEFGKKNGVEPYRRGDLPW